MRSTVAAIALALVCACETEGNAPGPSRVVLVVLDSVRADHVGTYGYDRPTTPRLDALAGRGLVYERAYAGSSSRAQSLSTLWTGRLPSSGGATGLREASPHPALLTLPRLFLRAGFRTGLVSNHGALRERGFTRGFDDVEVDSEPGRWSGELVTEKALELVDEAGDRPLFLTVDYADAAEPHLPSPKFRDRIEVPPPVRLLSLQDLRSAAGNLPDGIEGSPGFLDLVARYDAEVAYVDACLGKLVDGLEARGGLEDTLLIVTSSQGTEFLEHGYVGASWTLFEEVVRVPFVVHAPGYLSHARIEEPVSLADVVPSLRRVFGLDGGGTQGALFTLSPDGIIVLLASRGEAIAELVIPELCILRACIRERWKRIDTIRWAAPEERLALAGSYAEIVARMHDGREPRPDPWGDPVRRELYDLAEDPRERRDATESDPEAASALGRALAEYADTCAEHGLPSRAAAKRMKLPEGVDSRLRQLGYL